MYVYFETLPPKSAAAYQFFVVDPYGEVSTTGQSEAMKKYQQGR
jgi:hypothetical protein